VVNTPTGQAARADGYEIRVATVSMNRPIITTVQELAAAVQGVEAMARGEVGVRSLQEHGRHLVAGIDATARARAEARAQARERKGGAQ